MLDLDHFKAFNDERGHLAGDRHLAETARVWRTHLRAGDLLVRFGGEEFLAVLPSCPPVAANIVVERMRTTTPNSQTCSAGIAHFNQHESAEQLLARADSALYEAKRSGRNRAVTAPPKVYSLEAQMVQPPSTTSTEPVTYEAASEAR